MTEFEYTPARLAGGLRLLADFVETTQMSALAATAMLEGMAREMRRLLEAQQKERKAQDV